MVGKLLQQIPYLLIKRSSRRVIYGRKVNDEKYAIHPCNQNLAYSSLQTWKKRWFVLRPQHIAYYKTAAEYQLLRLLELSDVHSCTQVSLKRHDNTFGLVSPVRTFYLQAKTQKEVQEWVTAIDLARQTLSLAPKSTVVAPITIPVATSISAPPPLTPSPPNFPPHFHNTTSSESEDASPDPRSIQGASNAPASPTRPSVTDPGKVVVSGYLMKCGSKRRTWRKRWFVLTGEKLVYYASHMVCLHPAICGMIYLIY